MVLFLLLLIVPAFAATPLPKSYTELVKYVQPAPDQGETDTCLFMASTGAMELIANKKAGITDPKPLGTYDLSESWLINAPYGETGGRYFWEVHVLKFNNGFGIHTNDWPYEAWNEYWENASVWNFREWRQMPKVSLPKVDTEPLFVIGGKWSTNVLDQKHITQIKEALVKHRSPVMVNYVDDGYWHVILIVGYDDELPGRCYGTDEKECNNDIGSFYVRDSFGIPVEVRDYDWFRVNGNMAIVVKEAKE